MSHEDLTTKQMKTAQDNSLLDRVVLILEQAHTNVVRTVNGSMVTAYWLIGREIVLELQGGDERAEYGKRVIETLSKKLIARYGRGFSTTNLWYFKQFYVVYQNHMQILHPSGRESDDLPILHPPGGELGMTTKKNRLSGDESVHCFNPQLSWSHYRALIRVSNPEARLFYEKEAAECGWSKAQLERQIQTSYYEGKGFSFVARQKHIRFDDDDFYVDLVFYNFMLKCFVLIDLKIGKLTHQDVGQMDGYVRLFEDRFKVTGDNQPSD